MTAVARVSIRNDRGYSDANCVTNSILNPLAGDGDHDLFIRLYPSDIQRTETILAVLNHRRHIAVFDSLLVPIGGLLRLSDLRL